ncbi:hypothetical protein HY479_02340 [Candidatus Uhrbacteria bacterium]|nr:hypothetical protein [Candidatus Uhrbacteria bacterium]
MEQFLIGWTSFLDLAGESPFAAMWVVFLNGGWIAFTVAFFWALSRYWLNLRQIVFGSKKEWMLLAITIPRMTEQTPRAVENIFAHLAGAHSPASWKEKWIDGKTQDQISMEIVSIEGRVRFMVYTTRPQRDLIEATIYAQYPDAEIAEVEDYTLQAPTLYPDPEWDVFGTEMIPVKKTDVYPLRTYHEFEDQVSGEFKDPMAVILENLSRLGPGEQGWYQIVITPIDQKAFREKGEMFVKKFTGQKIEVKKGIIEQILTYPFTLIGSFLQEMGVIPAPTPPKKQEDPFGRVMKLTPGERKVLEAVENKISKIVFLCKIRFIYVAKREVMKKSRIIGPFVGGIKQFNTNDMQALKPESKRVGVNSTLWFFKDQRNGKRKTRLMRAYRARSNWVGIPAFHLSIEELASLWHFPITVQTKAPQLQRTEAKRSEPPINLPFG